MLIGSGVLWPITKDHNFTDKLLHKHARQLEFSSTRELNKQIVAFKVQNVEIILKRKCYLSLVQKQKALKKQNKSDPLSS